MDAAGRTFKVGDRVRRVNLSMHPNLYGFLGDVYTVLSVTGGGGGIEVVRGFPGASTCCFDLVEPAAPPSAIRTVTRREIVPGTYGGVIIDEVFGDSVSVDMSDCDGSAESLREAAHLFNQLAEVLEENAKAAA